MPFNFKFQADVKDQDKILWKEAEKRLTKIGLRHDAILGATVNIETEVKGKTPHLFRASVVVEMKPKNIAASKKAEKPQVALKEALDAVDRQIDKLLERMKKPWEEPGDKSKQLKEEFTE